MDVIERIKRMPMDEFYRVCNRLVREMGLVVKNGVYREDTVVIDASMLLPGGEIRYVIIFLKKDKFTADDLKELVDFETLQIRWMIVTTGEIDKSAYEAIPDGMDINLLDGKELEKMVKEYGILEEEKKEGSYLPSVGKLDDEISWAEEFLKNKNYEKALEHVNEALRIKQTNRAKKLKARILGEMGKYDEALSLLKEVLVENVQDDDSWFILGSVLENMGRIEDAEEAYGQCVRFNSRNLGCWLNRGNILFSMEKYDEALLCYENALKIRQDLPDAWNNRGVVLKYMGKYDEAMRSYNAAIKYNPEFAQAYLNKAILFYEMRRYEEAENFAYQYLNLEKGNEGYLLLANIYMKRQMLGKAEEMAKKALEINPGNVEAREILRKIHGGKAKDVGDEVVNSINSIMASVPEEMEESRRALLEAQEYARAGEFEKVKEKLQEAKELMRNYADENIVKNAIIEDILEIAQEGEEPVPEGLESMALEDLRLLRSNLIRKIKRKGSEEKTKENLLNSLEKIRGDMEKNGLMNEEMEKSIEEVKSLIEKGEFSMAMENLLAMSAKIERERVEEMKRFLIEDTKELLREADMEAPLNLNEMSLDEIRALRRKALDSLMGKGKGGLGFKEMVNALSGGSVGVKASIISDIRELAELSSREIPEDLEDMDVESLKSLRREIIEEIKQRKEAKEEKYDFRGLGQVLLEVGKEDMLMSDEIEEDEYLANARGIIYFKEGNYEKAVEQFKRALAMNSDFKEAEFNLGYSLHILGNEDEAMIHLRKIGMEEVVKKKNLNP